MTGEKLYPKKSRTYVFLISYGILTATGGVLTAQSVSEGLSPGNAAGFMLVFGAGMFILTLIKSRKPLVLVFDDFAEVRQSRKPELIRYRNIISVSRKGKDRLVIILLEDGSRRAVTVWLKEFESADIERLAEFLAGKGLKKQRAESA